MEKQEIIKEISNENVLSGYDEDSTIIEIDKAIEFLNNKKVEGATHLILSVSTDTNYGTVSFRANVETIQERLETDQEYKRRLYLEEETRIERERQEALILKRKEAEEKATYLKLKQKFEK